MSVEIWDERGTDSPPFRCGACGIAFEQVGLEVSTDRGMPNSRDARMHMCLSCADEVADAAAEIRGRKGKSARKRANLSFLDERLSDIRALARELGYAVAIHGSLERDIDLLAVPWTTAARSADELAEAIRELVVGVFGATVDGRIQPEGTRAHGRRTWAIATLLLEGSYIDLSVMPTTTPIEDGSTT